MAVVEAGPTNGAYKIATMLTAVGAHGAVRIWDLVQMNINLFVLTSGGLRPWIHTGSPEFSNGAGSDASARSSVSDTANVSWRAGMKSRMELTHLEGLGDMTLENRSDY